jgi:hypothetical protein
MATSQIKKFQRAGAGNLSPWDLIVARDENSFKVTVVPGLLNNFLATNWSEEFTVSENSLFYAKAIITTDGTSITNVTIRIDQSAPKIQTPEIYSIQADIEILFGLIRSGAVYRTVPLGQIFVSPRLWLRVKKDAPLSVGDIPFDEYYYLV